MSKKKAINDTTSETRITKLEEKNKELEKIVKELAEKLTRVEEWIQSHITPGRRQPF